jgi:hypothetical protein
MLMRYLFIISILLALTACTQTKDKVIEYEHTLEWSKRDIHGKSLDSLYHCKTYLPVYSHIYHRYDSHTFDLTITVSIRNISLSDTVYILARRLLQYLWR